MPYGIFLQSELTDMATALNSSSIGAIYLYKDANGTVRSSVIEQFSNTNNFGYAYNFIDGTVVYSVIPVTSYLDIAWTYPYTVLTASSANLWSAELDVWIDAKETKAISVAQQKIVSKSHTTHIQMTETTTSNSFAVATDTIDLTTYANIVSPATLAMAAYWEVGMVVQIPNQATEGIVLFQHGDIKIKVHQYVSPETTTVWGICSYDGSTFKKGVSFKAASTTFKYYIYMNSSNDFIVSGNTSVFSATGTWTPASYKVYIGEDSTGSNNSGIKVHEILYYTSAGSLTATQANIYTYLAARWSLSTYNDTSNIAPATWTTAYSRGNRMGIITISTNFAISSGNGGTIQNWVDGSVSGGAGQEKFYYTGGQSVSGKYMGFALATPQKISGFKIIGGPDTVKTFDFQGSTNNSTWVSLGTFIYMDVASSININNGDTVPDTDYVSDGSGTVSTVLISNATAYQYYRMYGVSGTTSGSPYELEILFKIAS